MDAVAEFYSRPQTGGSLKMQPYRKGYGPKYAIPLKRAGGGQEYVGKAAGGIAEAVKMARSAAVNTFQRDSSKNDNERKYRGKSGASQQRFVKNSASGLITRMMDQDDNGKPIKKKKKSAKHKRSKIDELLGDDSY